MSKQAPSFPDYLAQFMTDTNQFPFQDYYILLVLRFVVYIYLFIKLSDILLGYQKPNLKTRVLRKFQFVYGEQILKQLDKDDINQLQLTISNTILNATKELVGSSNNRRASSMMLSTNSRNTSLHENKFAYQSQRRSLKHEDTYTGSHSTRNSSTKLKFDLDKNQYFDPPSVILPSIITLTETAQDIQKINNRRKDHTIQLEYTEDLQGQNEEDKLSPKHNNNNSNNNNSQTKQQSTSAFNTHPQSKTIDLIQSSQSHQQSQHNYNHPSPQPNIHYPQQQLQGIDPQTEQALIKTQQNLLHLSDGNMSEDCQNAFQSLPSYNSKSQSTTVAGSFIVEELDV